MKSAWLVVASVVLLACQGNTQQKSKLDTQKDSVSYSLGMDIGRSLKAQDIGVSAEVLAQGIKDKLSEGQTLLTEEQAQQVLMELQHRMMAKQEEKAKELGEKNKAEGEAFLAENGKKEGVTTLPSGLQYKVITMGTGRKPKATETVSVHYRGTFIDGNEFDSSYKRGEPATFPVNGVIKGWTEALQLMPVGSKWHLFVPPSLAYGEQGAGQVIPANATLIFEVELLAIK